MGNEGRKQGTNATLFAAVDKFEVFVFQAVMNTAECCLSLKFLGSLEGRMFGIALRHARRLKPSLFLLSYVV